MKHVILWLLFFCISCSPVTQTEPVANWSSWSQQDGIVVFVSDERVGAMTFIVVSGEVEFAVGDGITVRLVNLSPEQAVISVQGKEHILTTHESVRINNVTVLLDSIIIREK